MASVFWGVSPFDEAVEKATSELLPSGSEDIALNLEICDMIRSKAVAPATAMKSLKTRVNHKNPNVQLLALDLIDTCVKNGGDIFLAQITGREFVDNLVSILKQPALNIDVKNKLLHYLQSWALSLEGKSAASHLHSVYDKLLREGYNFPPKDPLSVNTAMTETLVAPDWVDSDVCFRCRTPFTFTNRKHHCRNCGQVFDHQCSSKTKPLPHFGITQEVRVCDGCYHALENRRIPRHSSGEPSTNKLRSGRQRSLSGFVDADLQRALELSLEENRQYLENNPRVSEPPLVDRRSYAYGEEEDDPDLLAAIELSKREFEAPRPSAPPALHEERAGSYYVENLPPQRPAFALPNYDLNTQEGDTILTFNQTVEEAQTQGGLGGRYGYNLNSLYDQANHVRPKLAMSLDDTDRKQQMLFDMSGKIAEAAKLYEYHLAQQERALAWKRTSYLPPQAQQSQSPAPAQATSYTLMPPQSIAQTPGPSSPRQERFQQQQQTWSNDIPAPVSIPRPEWHTTVSGMGPVEARMEQPAASTSVIIPPQEPPQLATRVSIPPPTTSPQQTVVAPMPPAHQVVATAPIPPHAAVNSPEQQARAYPTNQYMFPSAPAAAPLPSFPIVPSTEPQVYAGYSPPVQEPVERKEALLIEL